jgi:hypothetical protein
MTELPDNVTLEWLGRTLIDFRQETRDAIAALRRDIDMTIRLVTRLDHTVNALREDIQTLWLSHGDLRRRLETLENK